MNDKTDTRPASVETKKGFFASLLSRIDRAMKEAADKKASGSCCCSGDSKKSGSGKGEKCC